MKRILFYFLALVVLIPMTATLTSCGDDDPSDGLSGWYAAQLPSKGSSDYDGKVYHFINGNTVVYYNFVSGKARWDYSEQLSGVKGYYVQEGAGETYTYHVIDNKVYIPMQGRILTISGKSLRLDGSSLTFTKQ